MEREEEVGEETKACQGQGLRVLLSSCLGEAEQLMRSGRIYFQG